MRDTSFLFTRAVAPNSPDLNPVDCRIWGEMQQRLYQPKVYDVDGMKQHMLCVTSGLEQSINNDVPVLNEWRKRLHACIHVLKEDI